MLEIGNRVKYHNDDEEGIIINVEYSNNEIWYQVVWDDEPGIYYPYLGSMLKPIYEANDIMKEMLCRTDSK